MLRALLTVTDRNSGEDRTMIVLGLSHANLARLGAGQPIHFRLEEMNEGAATPAASSHPDGPHRERPVLPDGYDIFLLAGDTEDVIQAQLEALTRG